MALQDLVFSVGAVVLTLTLLPTLTRREARVPYWTSGATFAVLGIYAVTFATMGMWYSAFMQGLLSFLWLLILLFRRV